jgi:hypothetical protein
MMMMMMRAATLKRNVKEGEDGVKGTPPHGLQTQRARKREAEEVI